jgi:phosphate transport system substrate-binding protein
MGENSGVQITVGTSGTGGGFKKFCEGQTQLSNASRPIKDEEKAACAAERHRVPGAHRRQRRA